MLCTQLRRCLDKRQGGLAVHGHGRHPEAQLYLTSTFPSQPTSPCTCFVMAAWSRTLSAALLHRPPQTLHLFPGAFHMLLWESARMRQLVLGDMVAWMLQRIEGAGTAVHTPAPSVVEDAEALLLGQGAAEGVHLAGKVAGPGAGAAAEVRRRKVK